MKGRTKEKKREGGKKGRPTKMSVVATRGPPRPPGIHPPPRKKKRERGKGMDRGDSSGKATRGPSRPLDGRNRSHTIHGVKTRMTHPCFMHKFFFYVFNDDGPLVVSLLPSPLSIPLPPPHSLSLSFSLKGQSPKPSAAHHQP